MKIHFLLIDALNLIRRVYAAMPGDDSPVRADDARLSCVQSLQRALRECNPTHAVCIFDSQEPGWRHQVFEGYKGGRSPMPEALRLLLPSFKESFRDLNVTSVEFPAVEADDIIATLASKVASRKGHVTILSTDKVFLQLLSDYIIVRDHFQKRSLDRSYVMMKFGIRSDQFIDFLSLTGDSTNNIVGIPSVGPKTAASLLSQFETLEDILSSSHVIPGKVGEAIRQHSEDARMAQTLVRLRIDMEFGLNLQSFRYGY
jgi:protein Xni